MNCVRRSERAVARRGERRSALKSQRTPISWIFGFIILLLVGAGLLIYSAYSNASFARTLQPEILMSIVIVLAIVIMMALLFAIAAGFSSLRLANPNHPLGLPEGSIRAMIALILILVFIIFGVYLFRSVGVGDWEGPTRLQAFADVVQLGESTDIRRVVYVTDPRGNYYEVWMRTPIGEDGARLAQQLITTVGTLVVAVAGFYFGSSTLRSGVETGRGQADTLGPVILSFAPNEGKKGDQIDLTIKGRNLRTCQSVILVRGEEEMPNVADVVSSDSEVTAQIRLTGTPGGEKWDIVVENENGRQDMLPKVFELKS